MAFKKGQSGNPKGKKPGTLNKVTVALKDAILQAAENAGGEGGLVGYLQAQAGANPSAFMALVGKVLPMQVSGDKDNPVQAVIEIRRTLVDPAKDRDS